MKNSAIKSIPEINAVWKRDPKVKWGKGDRQS